MTMATDPSTTRHDEEIRSCLGQIYDPCSVAAGRPTSLIDMGLVVDWRLDGAGTLVITFCVTWTGCTMAPHFIEAAKDGLLKIDGIDRVEAIVDMSVDWTPARMAPDAAMSPRRPAKPQAWRQRSGASTLRGSAQGWAADTGSLSGEQEIPDLQCSIEDAAPRLE